MVQVMLAQTLEEFLERQVLALRDFGPTLTDCRQIRFRRRITAVMALKVLPPSFAQKLGPGTVLLLLDLLHLLRHSRGEGDRQGISGSHGITLCYLITTTPHRSCQV